MQYASDLLIGRVKQLPEFKVKLNNLVPANYWIIGIRSEQDEPNKFDDMFYLMKGGDIVVKASGTTNPGTTVLQGGYLKYNKDGAAVVEADRIYPNVWKYRLHQGKIPALCQFWKGETEPITIFRDGDGDNKAEEIGKRTTGWYGINFHPDQFDISKDTRADNANVGDWSAGCQVCNSIDSYRKIIELTKSQSVTYVLLNQF